MDKIFELIERERQRQAETLMLIPSENYTSKAVREAVGSVLMNKYAEGQVGRRYYQGNEVVDQVETVCKERALQAFGLNGDEWGVNVQAHSGSPANLAVYRALLEPGERIMAMHLSDGGHLSHGWELPNRKISISSIFWHTAFYHVDPGTARFDYDQIQQQAEAVRPALVIAGGTAYPREIDHQRMGQIAHSVGAYYMADIAHEAGLVAAGANLSPFTFSDVVTMTTHKTLRGPRGALIFSRKKSEIQNLKLQNALNEQFSTVKNLSDGVDFAVFPGMQGGPHMHSIAGIAVALGEAMTPDFKDYAKRVIENAQVLAGGLMGRGFDVVSGGTDKHLVLVDLRNRNLSGWVAAWALEAAGIVTNRNTVPGETASPFYPSGIRLGSPAVTTRGMGSGEMEQIVGWIDRAVKVIADEKLPEEKGARIRWTEEFGHRVAEMEALQRIREEVKEFCFKFPLEQ